jgi:ribonuclease D
MPQENLIAPDTVRRVCWEPPQPVDTQSITSALTALGARPWQVEQVTPVLVAALSAKDTGTPRTAGTPEAGTPGLGAQEAGVRQPEA